MADYAKREKRPDEIYKSKSSTSKGGPQRRLSPYEQLAIHNWRNFTPEGRRQVHNERFHGAAWYGGPGTDAKVGSDSQRDPMTRQVDEDLQAEAMDLDTLEIGGDWRRDEHRSNNETGSQTSQQEEEKPKILDARIKGAGNLIIFVADIGQKKLIEKDYGNWDVLLVENLSAADSYLKVMKDRGATFKNVFIRSHGNPGTFSYQAYQYLEENSVDEFANCHDLNSATGFEEEEKQALQTLESIATMLEDDAVFAIGACHCGNLNEGSKMGIELAEALLKIRPDSKIKIYLNQDNSTPYLNSAGANTVNVKLDFPITNPFYFNQGWTATQLDGKGGFIPTVETRNNLALMHSGSIVEVNRRGFIALALDLGFKFMRLDLSSEK
jgi:hypothetical protein